MGQKQIKRRRRERREVQARLAEQLRLLNKRCREFDSGDWGEAVDIATRLRVIFHPGSPAKHPSILQSLGAEKVPMLSTVEHREDSPNIIASIGGLYTQSFAKDDEGLHYDLRPKLWDSHVGYAIPALRWWEQIVEIKGDEMDNPGRHVYRRKDVVTGVANHDGGAHLASQIPESYDMLSRPGGIVRINMGTEDDNEEIPIAGVHLAMLRQIAHEVLHSPALLDLTDPSKHGQANVDGTPVRSPGGAASPEGAGSAPPTTAGAPDPLRDTIALYFAAYYREVRNRLSGKSYGIDTVPSHLMPWKKLVRVWESRDGHYFVEHISGAGENSWLGQEANRSDLYEDYMHVCPPQDQTLKEMTGLTLKEDAAVLATRVFGRRVHDPGYGDVQRGNYVERVDAITRAKVSELTEDSARVAAQADLHPYVG
jgi:hypothetical protein